MEVINIQKEGGGVRQRRVRTHDVTVICKTILGKKVIKVTGHPFWRFAGNRYCMRAQNQSDFHQIFTKCSPVHAQYGHGQICRTFEPANWYAVFPISAASFVDLLLTLQQLLYSKLSILVQSFCIFIPCSAIQAFKIST